MTGKRFSRLVLWSILLWPMAGVSHAGVNLELEHTLTVQDEPLDVVATPDGKYVFVLTKTGDIAAFDEKGVLQTRYHVGAGVDQLKMDFQGKRLFAIRRSDKSVQMILMDFFFEINTAGAPSLGNPDAPLVFAVFSDFQ